MTTPGTQWLAAHFATVLGAILLVPFLARILRERRPPASTIAWLLAVLAVPYVGVPLYLFLGSRKVGNKKEKARLFTRASSPPPADLDPIARLLFTDGIPAPSAGNAIELLPTGEAAFARLVELIGGARRSVDLATFILANDGTGRRVVEALAARAAAGVRVRVLLDGLFLRRAGAALDVLRSAGVKVAVFSPLLRLSLARSENLRNHRKLTLVDGEHAWMGGMNVAEEYMGPDPLPDRWRDLAAHVRGPAVDHFAAVFEADFAHALGEPAPAPRNDAPRAALGQAVAQVVPSGPDAVDDSLYEALLTACYGATERIWLATPYFVPDEALSRALMAATRRGVDVLIVVPRRSNHLLADLAGGSYLRPIAETGARVATYPRMLHAKAVLVDRSLAVIGSANFDMRSLFLNYEIALFAYSAPEVDALARWFQNVAAECGQLAPSGRWRSLAEDLGRLFAPIS
ncbi:MAG TPA: phospholipase D-like domain-containing protein [Polyangiaceae bacterium]|nr:phospholipase D-like domain-containing protein [Polyangiaceae bacterium]